MAIQLLINDYAAIKIVHFFISINFLPLFTTKMQAMCSIVPVPLLVYPFVLWQLCSSGFRDKCIFMRNSRYQGKEIIAKIALNLFNNKISRKKSNLVKWLQKARV